MPHIANSSYRANGIFRNGHFNTVWAAISRKVAGVNYRRERLDTPDGDFVDLDWSFSKAPSTSLLVALHGLEGNAERPYIKGLVRFFNQQGCDAVALNFRGCSGEANRLTTTYHAGATADLHATLEHVLGLGRYRNIVIAGFSLGGNVVLKYLGEQSAQLFEEVRAATGFSVPCHLPTAHVEIGRWPNRPYLWKFLRTLNRKMKEKSERWPGIVPKPSPRPRNFDDFDNRYTAPLNGFKNALDYWERNSSLQFFDRISRPALLVNAWDDSFLSPECYPTEWAAQSDTFFLETPQYGGHVGFVTFDSNGVYWTERRAWEFVQDKLK